MKNKEISNRIFVTGASGFVGAAVVRKLIEEGRHVAVLIRESSNPWRLASVMPKLNMIYGDLKNLEAITDQLRDFAPQALAHLAWEGVKGVDRNHPKQLDNIQTTFSLYQLAKQVGISYIVGLGSQAEYGPCSGQIHESTATNPTTVYGATKLSTSITLERLAAAENFDFGWLRLFSTYGPADDPSWLIPSTILQLIQGKCPDLTAAEQLWDYLYIDDVAGAVIAAIDNKIRGFYNLGSGCALPLRQIIELVRDQIDSDLPLGFGEKPYRSDQVMHLEANIGKLKKHTGWQPNVTLESGIASTVSWFIEPENTMIVK